MLFGAIKVLAQPLSELAILTNQVQQLLKENNEKLDAQRVKQISTKILENRQLYSNDIIAKMYLLSATVASNNRDINQVFKFSQSGLSLKSRDNIVNLSLLLKLAEVYLARKQYQQLISLTQSALKNSEFSLPIKYELLLLSYRSVALAVMGEHQQALKDLQQIELGMNQSELTEHIKLLTIIALSFHHLGDYQTALTMQLKILKLRYKMDEKGNLDQTYLYLGYAYFYLLQFDDAYNAFWESKKHAENKKAPISAAYANKGTGIVLLNQQQYFQAIAPLEQAVTVFQQNNMQTQSIESMVALAKATLGEQLVAEGHVLLKQVLQLLNGQDIAIEFTGFYSMVAEMYRVKNDYQNADFWRAKHVKILREKLKAKKKASALIHGLSHLSLGKKQSIESIAASRNLAVKLASSSELSSSFIKKYQKQRTFIISLAALVCLLVITLLAVIIRLRAKRISSAYEELHKPSHVLLGPRQTKFDYQRAFNKARKFQYPLSVGYLVIENWQELTFRFNKKTLSEVTKTIASLINEQLTDFDITGLLTEGEYLVIIEHQSPEEVANKIDKLVQDLNNRAFANLGSFSIIVKYSLTAPDFKDIDPYLFLARMAESVNVTQINQSKVS